MVTKIFDGLKIPANCSGICVPILNEAVAKNRKIMPFHKRADKRLSDIQKGLIFATSAVLEIADELTLAQNEIRPPNLKKFMGHTVDSITLMGRAQKQVSAAFSKRSFGYTNGGAGARFSASHYLNFQRRKRNHQHRGESSSSTKYITSKTSYKY